MQTKQLHIRLQPDDAEVLDRLGGKIISRQSVGAMLLSAAIAAVRKSPNQLKFPPCLEISDMEPPQKPKR